MSDGFELPFWGDKGRRSEQEHCGYFIGSTYGYIRRYNVPAFSEAGIESIRFRIGSNKKKFCKKER